MENFYQDYEIIIETPMLYSMRVFNQTGVMNSEPGDLVLVAGKGHEQFIVDGNNAIPFDDRVVAREVLAAKKRRDWKVKS